MNIVHLSNFRHEKIDLIFFTEVYCRWYCVKCRLFFEKIHNNRQYYKPEFYYVLF